VNLSDRLSDFAETAAIVESLDLIISIDTSVAHLAGAMGKPVWTLLPCIPDWRWMLEREDSPWYPTMRLFRQQKAGDWESVIDQVGSALHNYLHNLGSLILEKTCDTSIDTLSEKGYKLLLGADLNIDGLLQEAIALQTEQKLLEATQIYQHILRHQPDNFNALYLLGIVISCQEKPAKAIEYFQRTIALKPDHAEAHKKIGDVYCQLEKPEEAIAYYKTACKIKPNYSAACCACAEILVNEAKVEEAIAYYQQVLRYEPDHAIANFMGFLLIPTMYDREEQIADWRQKFTIGLKQYISQSTESLEIKTERQKIFDALGIHTNFYLAYQAKNDLELQQLYGKFLCLAMAKHYPEWTQPLEISPLTPEGKIRIAYISPHLGDHAGTRGLIGWLRYRDRSKFEVYCYYTEDKPRVGMDAFQAESDRFYHLPNNLEKICKQVYADRIHILVFPDIGMHPLTNYLGALRLAPVQCVCWGHPVTTGLPTVDYFLSSDLMEPEDAQTHYSEQLIRLPQLGLSYLKPSLPAITKTRAAFNLPEDAIVYLTCQSWFKYLPQNDYIFARIATCVPNSKFVFIATDFPHINIKFRQRLQRAFTQFDLDVDRYCIFLQRQLGDDYLSLHLVSDIFLDTIDWSGGSTTLEAIACGSAIVTLPGEFMRGRHSYAMLKILQVEETIANNKEEYIEIAIKLAKDPNWRLSIVQRMCDRHNVLFDDQISVRALEEFYQSVVHQSVGHQSVLKAPDLSALLAGAIAEHKAGRLQEAEVLYRKILQHQPQHFSALNMLGTLASQSGRPEVGIPYILQALEIDPQSAEVHTNLGCAYMQQNDLENAIAHLLRAIALKPDFPDSHNSLGCSYIRQGNLEEAIAHYQQALLLNPNYVDAHYNLGLALLSVGDLKQGFAEYEWRWQRESFIAENPIPPSSQPFWDGTDFRNRTLLIYSEQGLGDTLQFSRYLPMVKAKGGKLLLACPESLQHLLASIEGIEIAPRDLPLPKFDLRFPLMSLPYIFGTTLETIPASVPYLAIPAISRSAIALEISQQSAKLKVGLVWASNPSHSTTPNRSFPLSSYLQLLDIPNIKFYSLQKDISDLDLVTLQQNQSRLENLSDYLSDFASTAAIVESLDLIISIDTSVAHLAGAMGKPIWTLLSFATDWRWMLEREDSPWYPTMRLFRQPKAGDWASAISMVRDALHNHMTNSFSLQLEPVINTSIATQIEERYELSSADRTDNLNPDALLNEAIALHQAGNLTEAAALYNEILQHQPQHFHALHMLGVIAAQSNQLETGIAYFQKALELNPSDAVAHSFLGLALLTQGDLQNGFREYEWRWQNPIFLSQHPTLPYTQPQWDGGNSLSQTLLIYCEQGFGDAIQFCRYIPLAKNKVKNIIVDCPEPLRRLFRSFTSIPGIAIAAPNLPLTAFDVHISLISLPQVLKTTLETIPAQVPYLSGLDTSDRADIPSQPNQLKVGLVWASKVNHATAPNRTCALNELNALMDIPGVSFYSLQKEKSDRDREVFAQWLQKYPGKIQDLSDRLDDFADTAVILEQLDLLISIDTAVAHLGGALAKSTWLLLPFAPDWRWMLDREDSPWYPTMRLFRQQEQGNWQEPIARVAADLANLVETNQANIHHDWNHMSLYAPNKIEIGIGWSIGAPIGWGVFGLNLALQMLKTKKFEPYLLTESFRGDGFFNPLHQKLLNSAIAKQQEMQKIITQNPGRSIYIDIPILHALDNITLASKTPHIKGKHNFGYIFFEGAYFNPEAIDTARGYDLILAGSKWNADKLTNCGLTNVCHVIQGIDPTIFHPAPRSNLFGDRFVIFSGGKLEYRKGQDIVVAAFKIFQARHPDALLLTTWHNFWPQFMAGIDLNGYVAGMPAVGTHGKLEIEKWLVDNGLPAESFIDLGLIPNHVTPQILREADVALFPNRCEGGTNLVAMECLACGVPTILSANTGHLDLIDDSHCYPLNNQKPVNPHPHFTSVEDWGESDVNEVVEILECIYSDRDRAKRKGHKAAVFMQELTWENQVQRILNKIMPLTLGATI
jgi:predicted O-linked N-acetylglucosamine transferase (SPINDLY family)/glycosyltransferase involved in cell wall biosynthesis/ADP-heptose:LPS heptosyltransferase